MAIISTLLRATNFNSPFLRTLVPSVASIYGLQAAVGIPSILAQTERFYDISASLTYLSVTALSLSLPALRAGAFATVGGSGLPWLSSVAGESLLNWRQVALSTAVGIWATRLGSFLFQRILADGQDSRFDRIRGSPSKFAVAFTAQATWITLCSLPVIAVNALPRATFAALLPSGAGASASGVLLSDVVGLGLFVFGFLFEVVADRQKDAWVQGKKQKKHSEEFLTRGLWSKSRHPNYFGEICLWSGITTVAGGVLVRGPAQVGLGFSGGIASRVGALAIAGVSPAFVALLLLKVSGVPLSETKYDKKFGDRKDYQQWKKNTPMLIPKFF